MWLVALLLLVLAGWLGVRVDPTAYEGVRARDEQERLHRNSSAFVGISLDPEGAANGSDDRRLVFKIGTPEAKL